MNKSLTNILFIDFETTGINVFNSDAIEIGAIFINKKLNVGEKFTSFIRPFIQSRMKASSLHTHGHSIEDLKNKPEARVVLTKFFNLFGYDYCFAGWNISFDIPYFKKLCYRCGMIKEYNLINYRHIDVQTIARWAVELQLVPSSLKSLDDWSKFIGLNRSSYHSALEDAELTFSIYKALLEIFSNKLISI